MGISSNRGCYSTVKTRLKKARSKGFLAGLQRTDYLTCPYKSQHGNSAMFRKAWLEGHSDGLAKEIKE